MNKLINFAVFNSPVIAQVFRFGVVGISAATLHFFIVVALVQLFALAPLLANVFAFIFSFQLSYWGHKRWTFQANQAEHAVALPRLLLVQVLNFGANELLFYIFLSLHLPYPLALIIVLLVLPIFTFVSSKWWVFR